MVGRQVIETKGKAHSERGALSDLALHLNRTAVKPYQLLHKGKTNPGAFVRSAALPFDTMEPCEDIGQLWFGDSDAGVFHETRHILCDGSDVHPASLYIEQRRNRSRQRLAGGQLGAFDQERKNSLSGM